MCITKCKTPYDIRIFECLIHKIYLQLRAYVLYVWLNLNEISAKSIYYKSFVEYSHYIILYKKKHPTVFLRYTCYFL